MVHGMEISSTITSSVLASQEDMRWKGVAILLLNVKNDLEYKSVNSVR